MAPIRIRHIVSFSSQDPKHPAENLLMEGAVQPWLSCPRDRSRQLRVELQLERACRIRYIDIGNSGTALLQIDVGRSIWPLDKGYATLLPTTTLMSPADSRAARNLTGVRMFKEGDFLPEVGAEPWDRLRLTCSQPFSKQQPFGLSFIRVSSAPSEEEEEPRRANPQDGGSAAASPLPPAASSTDPEARSRIEEKLREKLRSPASPPPAGVSRSARMLQLSAAKSRKRCQPATAPPGPPIPQHGGDNGSQLDSPMSSGSCPETLTARLRPSQKEHVTPGGRRRLKMMEARRRRRAQIHNSESHVTPESAATAPRSTETATGVCPICAGRFPAARLPLHAAACGDGSPCITLSSSSDDDNWDGAGQWADPPLRPASWVPCPLCGFPFPDSEIERHAATCGE